MVWKKASEKTLKASEDDDSGILGDLFYERDIVIWGVGGGDELVGGKRGNTGAMEGSGNGLGCAELQKCLQKLTVSGAVAVGEEVIHLSRCHFYFCHRFPP